jgi:nitrate/nitrite transport system substrate-binding protein
MRRWGQIPEAKPDQWYADVARQVYRPDIYLQAANLLVEEGLAQQADFPIGTDGYRPPDSNFIDGMEYDGRKPNAYLEKFAIGLKGDQKAK